MSELIVGERVELVPVTPAAARAVIAGHLSAIVGLRPGPGWPLAETLGVMRLAVEHGGDAGWLLTLGGHIVGDIGTHGPPDSAGVVEIRYALAPPFRGRGLATEACGVLVSWLLGREEVRLVTASTHAAGNPASRRVLEKCGFVLDQLVGPTAWYILPARP